MTSTPALLMAAQQRVVPHGNEQRPRAKALLRHPDSLRRGGDRTSGPDLGGVLGPEAGTQHIGPRGGMERKAFLHSHSLVRVVPWLTGPCCLLERPTRDSTAPPSMQGCCVHKEQAPSSLTSWVRLSQTVRLPSVPGMATPAPLKQRKPGGRQGKGNSTGYSPGHISASPPYSDLLAGTATFSATSSVISRGRPSVIGRALRTVPDLSDLCYLLCTPETSELQTFRTLTYLSYGSWSHRRSYM